MATTVVLVSPFQEDHQSLSWILALIGWQVESAADAAAAAAVLRQTASPVVVCERELPDGTWRDILSLATAIHCSAQVVVLSRQPDEYLWAEVLNLGGCDVLLKPFDASEVLRVMTMARRQCREAAPEIWF